MPDALSLRRGRPRSTHRQALGSLVGSFVNGQGRFSMGDLARNLGVGIGRADDLLRRALAAGEVRRTGQTTRTQAKRPVALYEPALQAGRGGLADAMACWPPRRGG